MTKPEREQALELISEACSNGARKYKACDLLGVSLRTVERWEKPRGTIDKRKDFLRIKHSNALSDDEVGGLMKIINSKEYRDLPPCQIVPLLADQGIYIASESTIYRILRKNKQLAHRTIAKPKTRKKPKCFTAIQPNQIWSWDITYLPTTVKGLYFYLYMIVDIYSRKIVGWSIHEEQNSAFSAKLINQACLDEKVKKDSLVLHSDNGKPMKGATMLAMLQNLGITPSFSRPAVSDDNPFSESLFKTVKYNSVYPLQKRFDTVYESRGWVEKFVSWYNNEHLHSSIKFVTPEQRHSGADKNVLENRYKVYQKAKSLMPHRWGKTKTRNWEHDGVVRLNQSKMGAAASKTSGTFCQVATRSMDSSV